MLQLRTQSPLLAVAAALTLATTLPAHAQSQTAPGKNPGPAATQAPASPAQDFSDEELQSFAQAYDKVRSISQEFATKRKNAKESAEKDRIRQRANERMVEAVRAQGLEPARYNEIANAIRNNPELAKRVQGLR